MPYRSWRQHPRRLCLMSIDVVRRIVNPIEAVKNIRLYLFSHSWVALIPIVPIPITPTQTCRPPHHIAVKLALSHEGGDSGHRCGRFRVSSSRLLHLLPTRFRHDFSSSCVHLCDAHPDHNPTHDHSPLYDHKQYTHRRLIHLCSAMAARPGRPTGRSLLTDYTGGAVGCTATRTVGSDTFCTKCASGYGVFQGACPQVVSCSTGTNISTSCQQNGCALVNSVVQCISCESRRLSSSKHAPPLR